MKKKVIDGQVQPVVKRYEYLATQPRLPLGATSPIMDSQQMTEWLNLMATHGWDFIGYGEKWWHDQDIPQQWWIFRRIHSKV